jgi:hypothetical protein
MPELTARARRASDEVHREGTPVRFVRSVFVPEDDTCFYLFRAVSADAVREAATRAELTFGGVSQTLEADELDPERRRP